ncbi:MAG TPA: outer membrane lipoprotein-sorting protein [Rubrivivax sp.]|nr:outer membrane lipoprotein-sorting protein [Rubrivivax sp.]
MKAPTRHRTAALILCLATLGAAADAPVPDVPSLLKAADRTRMGADNLQVETQVTITHADGTPDKERRYRVFAQAEHRSLVLMQSPAEQGQKVLMLGDDFWLLMPGSQRAMRITPMQKLLGDASIGDIATLSWADDYTGTLAGEEPCGEPAQACLRLNLQASRKGVSYQRIELWLGKARHEPVKADLYVLSDKLAKRARFVMDAASAVPQVAEMQLQDELSSRKLTRVRYLSRKPHTVPAAWLNPMFLARNPQLE